MSESEYGEYFQGWDSKEKENYKTKVPPQQNAPIKHLPDEWFAERCPDATRDVTGALTYKPNKKYYNERLAAKRGERERFKGPDIPYEYPYTEAHGTVEDWLADLPAMEELTDFSRWWYAVNEVGWRLEDWRYLLAHYMRHAALYAANQRRRELGITEPATMKDINPMFKGFIDKIERGEELPEMKFGDDYAF